jgi:murein DD-endopeptidase MepM/ murein hydrolase activator NlpD
MGHEGKVAAAALLSAVLACTGAAPARAISTGGSGASPQDASATGAAQAPSVPEAGGSQYGVVPASASVARPVVAALSVPATALAGRPPAVKFRIDDRSSSAVLVRVTVSDLSTRKPVLVVSLGWVRSGRTVSVRWPSGARLAPGSYHVSLTARDSHSAPLLRRAHSSGVATLQITAPVETPPAPSAPPAGVPTPAQLAAAGAVFPLAGTHSFGGPENRFGAPRNGYAHQGQDVLTSEGTPVLAPLAGTISSTSYQAGGAGYYAVEHTESGFDFFFAHCMAGSLAVSSGASVSAGQQLCSAGQTGDATTPHLHFEMWVGGWRTAAGYPIDPLPYLQALDHTPPGG